MESWGYPWPTGLTVNLRFLELLRFKFVRKSWGMIWIWNLFWTGNFEITHNAPRNWWRSNFSILCPITIPNNRKNVVNAEAHRFAAYWSSTSLCRWNLENGFTGRGSWTHQEKLWNLCYAVRVWFTERTSSYDPVSFWRKRLWASRQFDFRSGKKSTLCYKTQHLCDACSRIQRVGGNRIASTGNKYFGNRRMYDYKLCASQRNQNSETFCKPRSSRCGGFKLMWG